MEPPPLPSASGRFRLRVQIHRSQDEYNLNAVPLRQFTIVKTPSLALPDLTLRELCDEILKRFKAIYPGELLFAVEKPQDSYGSDLYFGDRVRDVFEDNEVFRVIKGASIRSSLEPHRARSQSVQPNGVFQYSSIGIGKRSYGQSETENALPAQKRQRIVTRDPDRPLRSLESNSSVREVQKPEGYTRGTTVIQDSQEAIKEGSTGRAVNALDQVVIQSQRINSIPAQENGTLDPRPSIQACTSSTPLGRIQSPLSVSSSRCEVGTSGSEVYIPKSQATTQSKKKVYPVEDSSEQDRGQSISTAMTTPLSALQQPNTHSPPNDNKRLTRPTIGVRKASVESKKINRILPRKNVYEEIETDCEHPGVKPKLQIVPIGIGNSTTTVGVSLVKWKQMSNAQTSNKNSPYQWKARAEEAKARKPPETKAKEELKRQDQLQMEMDADRGKTSNEQTLTGPQRETKQSLEDTQVPIKKTASHATSELAGVGTIHTSHAVAEAALDENAITPASIATNSTKSNRQTTCTPLVPRGRPLRASPPTLHPSQSFTSSPLTSPPNVRLEVQIPLPPQLKRKVSFLDQQQSIGQRGGSAGNKFKQTTLVPPPIGTTTTKSTTKRAQLRTYPKASKPSKGKAKVVESPGKPPTHDIEISSNDEFRADSSGSELQGGTLKLVGIPGPAYRRHSRQGSASKKSQTSRLEPEIVQHDGSISQDKADNSSKIIPRSSLRSAVKHSGTSSQRLKASSHSPETLESQVCLSNSAGALPPEVNGSTSHGGSPAQLQELPEEVATPTSLAESKLTNLTAFKTGRQSESIDNNSEEGFVSTKIHNAREPVNANTPVRTEQGRSARLEGDASEKTANEDLEDDDSDDVQAEVDDQLLTNHCSVLSLKKHPSVPDIDKVVQKTDEDAKMLHTRSSGRPSLRRMNIEAQRTKEANLEAARARGLAKVEKMGNGPRQTGTLSMSSEEDYSDSTSTSSEDDVGEGNRGDDAKSREICVEKGGVIHSDLDHEDAEELGQQIVAKEIGLSTSATKPALKGYDLMFRPATKPEQNADKKDSKRPGRIGWAKLGKRFSANKQKTSG